jgi:AcrR family transcriptional regulator
MDHATTLMERRKLATVEEIVGAAIDQFSRNGFEDTTVDAIAAAAGCSRRTFYRYFGSKEDVLFYDLPAVLERLGQALDRHLAEGLRPWTAVSEAVIESHFAEDRPVQRMEVWLREPALLARYMQYVAAAEEVIVACLTRHRGTTPGGDDVAQVIATAAVGAYRTTIATHPAGTSEKKLTRHMRELLAMLDRGLGATAADGLGSAPQPERADEAADSRLRVVS